MKRIGTTVSMLVWAGSLAGGVTVAQAQTANMPKGVKPGVIGAIALNRSASYCHLRFPANREQTLDSDKPELKPATTSDIIDFYGPCDHDPLGKDEIASQKRLRTERELEDSGRRGR